METGQTRKQDNYGLDHGSKSLIVVSVSILSALFILDVLTTEIILSGGGVEYNPFMAGIVQNPLVHVLVKMLLLILVVFAAKHSEAMVKGSGTMLFIVIIGWYLLCVGNNLGSIVRVGFFG